MFIKNWVTKIPRELSRTTTNLVIVGGITTIIFDLFAFLLQFGKDSIAAGNVVLGLICIVLYYTKSVIDSSITLWADDAKNDRRAQREKLVNARATKVLNKVRDKVFVSESETMLSSQIVLSLKRYINELWNLKFSLPGDLINIVSTIIMFVGFMMVTTIEIQNVALFFAVICVISVATVYFSHKRGEYRDRYRKERKKLYEEEEAAKKDILDLEPQDERHSNFMIASYDNAMEKIYSFDKKDWRDINKVRLLENILRSLATIFIISIKIFEVGVENVNLETVLSIIALQTIYSQIIGKINSLVNIAERYREMLKTIQSYVSDVKNIFDVCEAEENAQLSDASTFIIPDFEIEYQTGERNYRLVNREEIQFQVGDYVLLTGPTGCGKTTFMKMLTGKIKFGDVMGKRFLSVMHYSDTRLGFHDVLSEVVFGEDYDEEKLLYILKGLHLYDEIFFKSNDVIGYLRNTKAENYSNGQKQRLLIARMLYNLQENVKIVAFDEATNALDDSIAWSVMAFIREFCKEKLLIIASHQVDICTPFATQHYEFVLDESSGVHMIVKK